MGYYINPPHKTKQEFLEQFGTRIDPSLAMSVLEEGKAYPVCLMDNGAFMAAGIAYCKEEVVAMSLPHDTRPKWWYSVNKYHLKYYLPAQYV